MFQETVEEEDDRLPTMDLGMGIWDGELASGEFELEM
jgi:hypothetical protein